MKKLLSATMKLFSEMFSIEEGWVELPSNI
jgi:hypothetical protein